MNETTRVWVSREAGEAYLEECLLPKHLSAKGGFMGW